MLLARSIGIVIFAVLLPVITTTSVTRFDQCLPCHCHRNVYPGLNKTAIIADCSRKHLTEIPRNLPFNIEVLIASHNPHIKLSSDGQFPYSNLKALVMHSCNIHSLKSRVFDGLPNLKILDLHSNSGIDFWSGTALAGLTHLEVLNITMGNVSNNTKPFANTALKLSNLKELNVRFLSNISKHFLTGLQIEALHLTIDKALYLPSNWLNSLPTSLKALYINSKSLRAIPEEFLHGALRNLEVFHLSVPYIPRLPDKLFHVKEADDHETENKTALHNVSRDWYDVLMSEVEVKSNLTEIWLIGVSYISPHLFKDLGFLRRLVIKHFYDISDDAFSGLATLKELALTDSTSFSLVSQYLFRKLYELTYLKISNTQIATLKEEDMEHVNKLRFLDLSGNHLGKIEGYTFWFMRDLQHLDLSRNNFTEFEQQLFEINKLITLDVSFNRLEELQEDMFQDLWYLKELKLRGNQLSSLPAGIFDSLFSIRWIDLSLNSFMNLSVSYIEECEELTTLDLSDNCVQTFDMARFKEDHPKLGVNLERNPLVGGYCNHLEITATSNSERKGAEPREKQPGENDTEPAMRVNSKEPSPRENKDNSNASSFKNDNNLVDNTSKSNEFPVPKVPQNPEKPLTPDNSIRDKLKILNDTSNDSVAINCSTSENSTSHVQNATSGVDCNRDNPTHSPSKTWIPVAVLCAVVVLAAVLCVTVVVVMRKRRSSYDKVRAEQEASVESPASFHYMGAGGDAEGIPSGPYDDDFPMEHTRFV